MALLPRLVRRPIRRLNLAPILSPIRHVCARLVLVLTDAGTTATSTAPLHQVPRLFVQFQIHHDVVDFFEHGGQVIVLLLAAANEDEN